MTKSTGQSIVDLASSIATDLGVNFHTLKNDSSDINQVIKNVTNGFENIGDFVENYGRNEKNDKYIPVFGEYENEKGILVRYYKLEGTEVSHQREVVLIKAGDYEIGIVWHEEKGKGSIAIAYNPLIEGIKPLNTFNPDSGLPKPSDYVLAQFNSVEDLKPVVYGLLNITPAKTE